MSQQTNRKKTTGTKTATAKAPASRSTAKTPIRSNRNNSAKIPRRREIMAVVCFLLSIFTFIGYWNTEGAFIGLFCNFLKGLVGKGFYAFSPALFVCAVILTFHRGKPVRFRTISTLVLTIVVGALVHLFSNIPPYEMTSGMFAELWKDGVILQSGGAISGTLAEVFQWLFSKAGALIVFICAVPFFLLSALNKTITDITDAIKARERREYLPEPEPVPRPREQQSINRNSTGSTTTRQPKAIDIPIDEALNQASQQDSKKAERAGFFSRTPRVKTPDQLIAQFAPDERNDENIGANQAENHESTEIEIIDMPLDIPFMETKATKVASGRNQVPSKPSDHPEAPESLEIAPEPPEPKTLEIDGAAPVQDQPDRAHDKYIESTEIAENQLTPLIPLKNDRQIDAQQKDTRQEDSGQSGKQIEAEQPIRSVLPEASATSSGSSETFSEAAQDESEQTAEYQFPPIEMLSVGTPVSGDGYEDEVKTNSDRLEAAFRSFGVNVTISKTTRGPAVTRYEAELEAGIKLSRLTGLADDIALSLGASGVRIAAMPNKISTVGIEVPNKTISTVNLRDIIESREFQNADSKMTFAVGMDISGEAIVGNISKLPHLLVAGTTGSGKSVSLNSLILSILYKATPDEVRFIMIDPKMVEFKVYNSIPHLLVPVVTDVKKAAGALQWAVVEMMKRYALFSETNARDIEGYNQIARESEEYEMIPQVIIVIDELADLMMMAAKEVEESVCRVAQMGRAAGMHLVIATQSPRADVITGLMKANIPSRIALKVSSALESRIILDAGGNADKLVGNGDMLYAPIGTTKPLRVQGTWVSDKERESVVEFIKKSGESQYSDEVMDEIEKAAVEKSSGDKSKDTQGSNDYDELLPQAVEVILETQQASVSMLQRRLKLGYSRAARIVDQLELMGVVGPFEGSKPRTLLITKNQWQQMQYINETAPIGLQATPQIQFPSAVQSVSESTLASEQDELLESVQSSDDTDVSDGSDNVGDEYKEDEGDTSSIVAPDATSESSSTDAEVASQSDIDLDENYTLGSCDDIEDFNDFEEPDEPQKLTEDTPIEAKRSFSDYDIDLDEDD